MAGADATEAKSAGVGQRIADLDRYLG